VGDVTRAEPPFACLDPTFIDLELAANRAEQEALRVDLDYFRKEVKRIRQLLAQKSSSESQLDAAVRNQNKTEVQLEALQIAAQTLRERKARHCIHTPAGWRVISRQVEPGEWINTGQPVVEIGDYRSLLVPFALSMTEYQAMQGLGENLSLHLPQQGVTVPARLLRVSPAFDQTSRKIQVELQISEGITDPRGGLRTELVLTIPLNSGAVVVPESALVKRYEQYWLRRPDSEEVRVVYLGREEGTEGAVVRVASPEVKAGDRFQRHPE
ncbi:MAG: HlyD family efflux transporter periplasmic adaptor subunit, partial [Candidatus Thiodiazotropha sp.]